MTSSELPDETSRIAAARHAGGSGPAAAIPGALAAAARTLSRLPADADDAALLAVLAEQLVPALGDALALCALDTAGELHVSGVAPAATETAARIRASLERDRHAVERYRAVFRHGGAFILAGSGASGTSAELCAPLTRDGRHEGLLLIGVAAPVRQLGPTDLVVVELLAGLIETRWALRELAATERELRRQLEAAALAGRELAHQLNNDLTMPVGVVELLLDRPGVSPDLREMIEAAAADLAALEQHIHAFHHEMREQWSRLAGEEPPRTSP